ncbi:MAG: nucleotidyltransferase substrate binding protein [Bacteroidetes bacterium]|nr:nucleotidyltransferase substrate binding protein [Bacteroidota bacterium]
MDDIRWKQRFSNYQKALLQLKAAVQITKDRSLSDLEKQGLIQGFEYTHELSWNVLRDFFRDQGIQNLHGSKDTVRKAFSEGLITDGQIWMEMILDRNRTSHTYNHKVAEEITHNICKVYCDQFLKLEDTLQELINADN